MYQIFTTLHETNHIYKQIIKFETTAKFDSATLLILLYYVELSAVGLIYMMILSHIEGKAFAVFRTLINLKITHTQIKYSFSSVFGVMLIRVELLCYLLVFIKLFGVKRIIKLASTIRILGDFVDDNQCHKNILRICFTLTFLLKHIRCGFLL